MYVFEYVCRGFAAKSRPQVYRTDRSILDDAQIISNIPLPNRKSTISVNCTVLNCTPPSNSVIRCVEMKVFHMSYIGTKSFLFIFCSL